MKRILLIAAAIACATACSNKAKEDADAKAYAKASDKSAAKTAAADRATRDEWIHKIEYSGSGLGDLLAAMQDLEPEIYEDVASFAETQRQLGETPERALVLGVSHAGEDRIVLKWSGRGDDKDLRDLLLVTADQLQQLEDVDPMLCATNKPMVIPVGKDPVGVDDRRFHTLAHIMRAPAADPQLATDADNKEYSDRLLADKKFVADYQSLPADEKEPTPATARIHCDARIKSSRIMAAIPGGPRIYRTTLRDRQAAEKLPAAN